MKDQKPLLFDATMMMMMKYLTLLLAITSWLMEASSSFVIKPMASLRKLSDLKMAQVELMPEPQGGEELTAISTMEGTRMKNMGEVEGMKSEDGTVYKFWLQTIANGELVKEYKTTILKDAKKKANFPGFRKGQIPPYAMPQISGFAIQEAIIKTVEQAVKAFGLKSLPGSDGEVEVLEDVKEMCKGYKDGTSLEFTATLKCVFDPEKSGDSSSMESNAESDEAGTTTIESSGNEAYVAKEV